VVGEAMIAVTLADMFLAKFGGDSLSDTLAAYRHYFARLKEVVGRDQ
jgi:chorismate synthase